MNYLLILLESILSYLLLLIIYKKYKLEGIYYYIILASIMSNIMILNTIDILTYPISTSLGLTTSIIISAITIIHKKGLSELPKIIIITLISTIISYSFLTLSAYMEASDTSKYTSLAYSVIFKDNLRLFIAHLISLITSIYLGAKLYYTIKKIKNKIWISNILTTIIVEFASSLLYTLLAYTYNLKLIDIIMICMIRYTIKALIAITSTPIIYLSDKIVK